MPCSRLSPIVQAPPWKYSSTGAAVVQPGAGLAVEVEDDGRGCRRPRMRGRGVARLPLADRHEPDNATGVLRWSSASPVRSDPPRRVQPRSTAGTGSRRRTEPSGPGSHDRSAPAQASPASQPSQPARRPGTTPRRRDRARGDVKRRLARRSSSAGTRDPRPLGPRGAAEPSADEHDRDDANAQAGPVHPGILRTSLLSGPSALRITPRDPGEDGCAGEDW